jgi:hypothetical protein
MKTLLSGVCVLLSSWFFLVAFVTATGMWNLDSPLMALATMPLAEYQWPIVLVSAVLSVALFCASLTMYRRRRS